MSHSRYLVPPSVPALSVMASWNQGGWSMASGRLNPMIEKLAAGDAVVSTPPVANGNWEVAQELGDSDYDMVIFEMEHFGFDFKGLRTSLQAMLNRRRIDQDGLRPSVVPATRVPPNA